MQYQTFKPTILTDTTNQVTNTMKNNEHKKHDIEYLHEIEE